MTVKEVIDAELAKISYPDTPQVRKLVRKRWISYVNEAMGAETVVNPVHYTQTFSVRNHEIFKCDLDQTPTLEKPTITQFGVPLRFAETYNNPKRYVIPDALDGQVTISYKACYKTVSCETDDLGIYSERIEKILSYVEMREHMYAFNRGKVTRRKEFSGVIMTDTPQQDIPIDTMIYEHKQDDTHILHFVCPCGCGIMESVEAIICMSENLGSRESVVKMIDPQGRPYEVRKSMPRALREMNQFMVVDGKITIRFIGSKGKKCYSLYTVENGIIKWRFMY